MSWLIVPTIFEMLVIYNSHMIDCTNRIWSFSNLQHVFLLCDIARLVAYYHFCLYMVDGMKVSLVWVRSGLPQLNRDS